ncbi:MAG: DUF721 domain-containing protein [Myxococcales bacterium]|nr:DUF721 domain-containing protein [Myxococcales bacterium]MCB9642985.1 DUF721 domain-containing protein [Myxococcales bacterium]
MRHPSSLSPPQGIASILQEALRKRGLQHLQDSTTPLENQVFRAWQDLAGEQVNQIARPSQFREGSLVVEVTEKVWLQELHYFRGRYLQQLNEALGQHHINNITFLLVDPEQAVPVEASEGPLKTETEIPSAESPRWLTEVLPDEVRQEIEAKLADMPEGEIKESARRIMIRHHQIQQMRHRQKRPRLH